MTPDHAIGNFTILEKIGEGRFAEIFKTYQSGYPRALRAVKLFKFAVPQDSPLRTELPAEAGALIELYHENITKTYACGFSGDKFYIAQEYVEGATLREILKEKGTLTTDQAIRVGLEISSALAYAHSIGMLHLDISARNVMLRSDTLESVVTDFGVHQLLSGEAIKKLCENLPPAHVPEAEIAKYPLAEPPEYAKGSSPSIQSDLYLAGQTIYDTLIGYQTSLNDKVPPPSSIKNTIPLLLDETIMQCLHASRTQRPASALQLFRALSEIAKGRRAAGLSASNRQPPLTKEEAQSLLATDKQDSAIPDSNPQALTTMRLNTNALKSKKNDGSVESVAAKNALTPQFDTNVQDTPEATPKDPAKPSGSGLSLASDEPLKLAKPQPAPEKKDEPVENGGFKLEIERFNQRETPKKTTTSPEQQKRGPREDFTLSALIKLQSAQEAGHAPEPTPPSPQPQKETPKPVPQPKEQPKTAPVERKQPPKETAPAQKQQPAEQPQKQQSQQDNAAGPAKPAPQKAPAPEPAKVQPKAKEQPVPLTQAIPPKEKTAPQPVAEKDRLVQKKAEPEPKPTKEKSKTEDQQAAPAPGAQPEKSASKLPYIAAVAVFALAGVAFYFFSSSKQNSETTEHPAPEALPVPSADLTPSSAAATAVPASSAAVAAISPATDTGLDLTQAETPQPPANDFFAGIKIASETAAQPAASSQNKEKMVKEMVFIKDGSFTFGGEKFTRVQMDSYYIDKYEVTVGRYMQCVTEGACNVPTYARKSSQACNWFAKDNTYKPMNCVKWTDALAFCEWQDKKLPTEAQWEKAARGSDSMSPFPWGEALADCSLAVIAADPGKPGCGQGSSMEIGSRPGDSSFYTVADMAGNVSEYVGDWYDVKYYKNPPEKNPLGPSKGLARVVKGGNWRSGADKAVISSRRAAAPGEWDDATGFRCVMPTR